MTEPAEETLESLRAKVADLTAERDRYVAQSRMLWARIDKIKAAVSGEALAEQPPTLSPMMRWTPCAVCSNSVMMLAGESVCYRCCERKEREGC